MDPANGKRNAGPQRGAQVLTDALSTLRSSSTVLQHQSRCNMSLCNAIHRNIHAHMAIATCCQAAENSSATVVSSTTHTKTSVSGNSVQHQLC